MQIEFLSDEQVKIRRLLKSIYDDVIDAENGADRNTFGFTHRLKVIHESLTQLIPRLLITFPQLSVVKLEDFDSTHYHKGDSGMAQLLKSQIKKLAIETDTNLESGHIEHSNNIIENNSRISNSLTFGNIIRLHNRELNAIFFHTVNHSSIKINSQVNETGLDLEFKLMTYDDYLKLKQYWDAHPSNPKNPSGAYSKIPSMPTIKELFSLRTNIIEKNFDLNGGTKYAWVFNNTYSKLQDKTVTTKIEMLNKTSPTEPKTNLPVIDLLRETLPQELLADLMDANDCYLQNHFRQSAIMFRKSLETAIKLKILQSDLSQDLLFNKDGNELRLSDKLNVLLEKKLISSKTKSDIDDTVKWFGDTGVHTKMSIVGDDVRHNIEPKFRKFITELNLKS